MHREWVSNVALTTSQRQAYVYHTTSDGDGIVTTIGCCHRTVVWMLSVAPVSQTKRQEGGGARSTSQTYLKFAEKVTMPESLGNMFGRCHFFVLERCMYMSPSPMVPTMTHLSSLLDHNSSDGLGTDY